LPSPAGFTAYQALTPCLACMFFWILSGYSDPFSNAADLEASLPHIPIVSELRQLRLPQPSFLPLPWHLPHGKNSQVRRQVVPQLLLFLCTPCDCPAVHPCFADPVKQLHSSAILYRFFLCFFLAASPASPCFSDLGPEFPVTIPLVIRFRSVYSSSSLCCFSTQKETFSFSFSFPSGPLFSPWNPLLVPGQVFILLR